MDELDTDCRLLNHGGCQYGFCLFAERSYRCIVQCVGRSFSLSPLDIASYGAARFCLIYALVHNTWGTHQARNAGVVRLDLLLTTCVKFGPISLFL